jgi:hypothetical protein
MGETIANRETSPPRCMSVSAFLSKWKGDAEFRRQFDALVAFVDNLRPEDKYRWTRLQLMRGALESLRDESKSLLADRPSPN